MLGISGNEVEANLDGPRDIDDERDGRDYSLNAFILEEGYKKGRQEQGAPRHQLDLHILELREA